MPRDMRETSGGVEIKWDIKRQEKRIINVLSRPTASKHYRRNSVAWSAHTKKCDVVGEAKKPQTARFRIYVTHINRSLSMVAFLDFEYAVVDAATRFYCAKFQPFATTTFDIRDVWFR